MIVLKTLKFHYVIESLNSFNWLNGDKNINVLWRLKESEDPNFHFRIFYIYKTSLDNVNLQSVISFVRCL